MMKGPVCPPIEYRYTSGDSPSVFTSGRHWAKAGSVHGPANSSCGLLIRDGDRKRKGCANSRASDSNSVAQEDRNPIVPRSKNLSYLASRYSKCGIFAQSAENEPCFPGTSS